MVSKPRPNHRRYLEILRRMTPAQRAEKMFELSAFTRRLFFDGLRNRHPDLPEDEVRALALKRLHQCHNRNY
jgi:hypothetical protein